MPNTPAKKPCQEHSSQGSAIEQGQRNQISSGSTYDNTRQQSLESYSEHQAHNSSGRISTAPTRSTSGRMGSGHSKLESREDAELKGKDLSGSSHQASYATVLARSMTEVDLSEGKSFFRADNSSNTLHHPIMSISTMRSEYQNLRSKDRVILPAYSVSVALMHNIAPAHANDQHPFYWTKFKSDKHLDGAYIRLRESHHGALVLSKNNYRLDTYGQASDLERHRMCRKCSKSQKNLKGNNICKFHTDKKCIQVGSGNNYHPCCNQMDPCQRKTSHDWEEPLQIFDDHYNSFIELPPHNPAHPKRRAIVMDCEMVGIPHNLSEVARICVVDYLTGDVLIDCFVDPVEQVHDWRSRFSGITKENMAEAKYDKNCFPNWRAARAAVLQFVDANTTLIGTALQNDLKILRLVHSKIVDCGILAQQKVGSPWTRNWGLKNLCKDILDLDIQISAHGHNPLEDCMATREVVLWMTFLSKERFNDWADVKREQEEKRFVEETRKAKERNEKDSQERAQKEFDAAGGYDQYLRDGYGLPES